MSQRKYLFTIVIFALWIASFYFLTDLAGVDFAGKILTANPLSIVLGFLLYALAVLSSVYILYKCLVAVGLSAPVKGVVKAWIFGSFIDNMGPTITPLGEASMAYFLEKFYAVAYTKSLAAIGMYVSSWGLSVSFFSVASLIVIQIFEGLQNIVSGAAIVLIVVAVVVFIIITIGWFLLITNRRLIEGIVCKLVGIYNWFYNKVRKGKVSFEYCVFRVEFDQSYSALEVFMKNWKRMAISTAIFIVPQLCHALCIYFLLVGFGVRVPFLAILLVHIVSSVTGLIFFVPSGIGVYELTSTTILTSIIASTGFASGVAATSIAAATTFIYRLIFVWATNIIGGLIGIIQGIEHPTKPKNSSVASN